MEKDKMYSPKEASKMLGVTVTTLQSWDKKGLIKVVRTVTDRRRIPQSEIDRLLGKKSLKVKSSVPQKIAIYARVSSNEQKQKGDLQRQIDFLLENVPDELKDSVAIVSDVGSGLNDKRKGLVKIMNMAKNKEITQLHIRYKDRLTRFGFNYLEMYMSSHDVEIVVMDETESTKTVQEELVEDLISIITSFSGKIHGLRSKKNKILKEKMSEVINNAIVVPDEDK